MFTIPMEDCLRSLWKSARFNTAMQSKNEEPIKDRFIDFIKREEGLSLIVIGQDVKARTGNKDFDYLLESYGQRIALEITNLFDSPEELGEMIHWDSVVGELNEYIKSQMQRTPLLGGYVIYAPSTFRISKAQVRKNAQTIAQTLINTANEIQTTHDRRHVSTSIGAFEIARTDNEPSYMIVPRSQYRALGRFYDQVDSLEPKLTYLIEKKNLQLDTDATRRVLLIVKAYSFADEEISIGALARIDPNVMSNIDEIYIEFRPDDFRKVYDRNIHMILRTQTASDQQQKVLPLLWTWLSEICDIYPDELFGLFQNLFSAKEPHEVVIDDESRANIVNLARIFLKRKEYDKAKWIVDRLVNDPSPSVEHPYHKAIMNGEEYGNERPTVRYDLAWILQELAMNPDTLEYAFEKIKQFTNTENLFVISSAFISLTEIVHRRDALPSQARKELHSLLMSLVRRFSLYPEIKKELRGIFRYYPIPASDVPQINALFR